MHVVTVLLMDQALQARCRMTWRMLQPLEAWHGERNVGNRDPNATLEFFVRMACGAGLAPLREVVRLMTDHEALQHMGFSLAPTSATKDFKPDHPSVVAENETAKLLAAFVVQILKHRTRSLLWNMVGAPGLFAALLLPERQAACLAQLRRAHAAWRRAQERGTSALWKEMKGAELLPVDVCQEGLPLVVRARLQRGVPRA